MASERSFRFRVRWSDGRTPEQLADDLNHDIDALLATDERYADSVVLTDEVRAFGAGGNDGE